ncbi:hypothetical protein [Chryseobacterium viscerum]|uniref:Uncharacterized protein n=1 Tax=Chryseobacterium viscerum TaxID=1037377 RepID=A0A316WKE7_9FLAO|nr:hypothetical protein [Chryseobacterium viscerum]KAB1231648.1 hypothetical protein F8D52_07530 [Chryseobacterium viscerum]PWN60933.1 hypothetical protein C1634_012750 [Chryseobacterium viscerum]
MKKIVIVASLIFLTACSNPTSKKYNEATITEDLKEIGESKKWNEKEAGLFAGWLIRAKLKGESLENKTYQNILDEAKKFKAEEDALAEKAKKEAEERKQKMKNAVTVTIFAKEYVPSNFDAGRLEDYNLFKYALQNKSSKEIKAAKISFKIFNALGEQIGDSYSMDFTDDRIAANTTFKGDAAFDYNQFSNDDKKIASAKFEDLIFDFDVQKVVYTDGSVLE